MTLPLQDNQRFMDIVRQYLLEPRTFWPDDTPFHRTNVARIERKVEQLGLTSQLEGSSLIQALQDRVANRARTLFIISAGASGERALANALASYPPFYSVGEIHFPPRFLELVSEEEGHLRHALLDLVALSGVPDTNKFASGVIPIGCLPAAGDPPVKLLRDGLPGARVVRVLRNPMDIALAMSRAKSSGHSRNDVDLVLLPKQISRVRRSFENLSALQADATVRIEDLANPEGGDGLHRLVVGLDWARCVPRGAFENVGLARKLASTLKQAVQVHGDAAEHLHTALIEHVRNYDYCVPNNVGPSAEPTKALWKPDDGQFDNDEAKKMVLQDRVVWVASKHRTFSLTIPLSQVVEEKMDMPLSWRMYFFCFSWVRTIADIDDPAVFAILFEKIDEIRKMSLSYLPPAKAAPPFWDDHAVAFRAANIAFILRRYRDYAVVREHVGEWKAIVAAHIDALHKLRNDTTWIGTNHAIFHALSALNLSLHLEGDVRPDDMLSRKKYQAYLDTVLLALIDAESGVSRERSLHYQVWTLSLFDEVCLYLESNEIEISGEVVSTSQKMLDVLDYITIGDLSVPAIGDTPSLNSYTRLGIKTKLASMRSKKMQGLQFKETAHAERPFLISEESGMAFARTGVGDGRDSLVTFTIPRNRGAHGHFDALSLDVIFMGVPLIVDAGGPYLYGNKLRFEYFLQGCAHNGLVVDGKHYQGETKRFDIQSGTHGVTMSALTPDNHGISHQRNVQCFDDHTLEITDHLKSIDGKIHHCSLLFHLSPHVTKIEHIGSRLQFQVEGLGHAVSMNFKTECDMKIDVLDLESDHPFAGWLTPKQGVIEPCRVALVDLRVENAVSICTVLNSNNMLSRTPN